MTQQIAYQHEPSFTGSPTMSQYLRFGHNTTLDTLSIENGLRELRWPDNNEVVDQIATTFDGSLSITFEPTNPWWLNHAFGQPPADGGEASAPYSYTWTPVGGGESVQSARVYVGVDNAGIGTVERELKGVVLAEMEVSCSVGEAPTVTLTGFYADESKNTSLTDFSGSLEGEEEPLVFHQGDLQVPESTSLGIMEDCTFSVTLNARGQRGWNRKLQEAVAGNVETRLSPTRIPQDTDIITQAYGNSTAPADSVDGAATARLRFDTPGDHALQIDVDNVAPNSYSWSNVLDAGGDLLEDVELYCGAVEVTAESAESAAL